MSFSTKYFLIRLGAVAACVFFVSNRGVAGDSYLSVGSFETDGERVYIEDPEISIETFSGWEGYHNPKSGVTLHMKGPEVKQREKSATLTFHPSFQIRTLHHSEPIDEQREASFKEELLKQFTDKRPLENFEILSAERIEFKNPQDTLVVYSSYTSKGLELLQLHVLRASDEQQYHITYTDLYDRLDGNPESHEELWQVINSLDYEGEPAPRYLWLWQLAVILLITFLIPMMALTWNRFRQMRRLKKMVRRPISTSPRSRRRASSNKRAQGVARRASTKRETPKKRPKVVTLDL